MMKGMLVDDNMSNLTSASNEAVPNNQIQSTKKKRNLPGNPDPEAEVIALSPRALMTTNRFICEICNKGFQRDQNLQLHKRGHNLPWKLKQRTNKEVIKKKVYVCPEATCVHHDPSRALGDLTGIKKHFSRKHGEKKWKCEKCSKRYAVQSDWKAHSKICGTREYRCDCGTLFSRRDSFITHRAFCDALAEESARSAITPNPLLSSHPGTSTPHFNLQPQLHHHSLRAFPMKREQEQQQSFNQRPEIPPWLACPSVLEAGPGPPHHELPSQLFSSRLVHPIIHHENPNPNPNPNLPSPSFQPTASAPHMSATALLQKAVQIGVTMSSKPACQPLEVVAAMFRPHQADMSPTVFSSTPLATCTAGSGLGLSSHEEMGTKFVHGLASFGNNAVNVTSGCIQQVGKTSLETHSPGAPYFLHDTMNSLSSTSGFEGSTFEDTIDGMLNPKPSLEAQLNRSKEGARGGGSSGGRDGLTRDFLGLRAFPADRDFLNMDSLEHISTSLSYHDQQNQNQTPWQG